MNFHPRLRSINHSGEHFALGCLAPKPDYGGRPKFAAKHPLIARAEWRETDLSPYMGAVWNQGQHGSCVGHGGGKAFEIAYRMAGGTLPPSGFSPTSLYALINGNRDDGAIVSDAMDALVNRGICTMAECPESIIFEPQIPAAAEATRKRFRVLDAYHCATFDEIATAIQLDYAVAFGIAIRSRFNDPGPNGVIEAGGYLLGGHCMCVYGLTRLPDGRWAFRVRNSWGPTWGVGGNCLLPETHFAGECDAFAVRAAQADPLDPSAPPVAVA